jgi:hypothetical protein
MLDANAHWSLRREVEADALWRVHAGELDLVTLMPDDGAGNGRIVGLRWLAMWMHQPRHGQGRNAKATGRVSSGIDGTGGEWNESASRRQSGHGRRPKGLWRCGEENGKDTTAAGRNKMRRREVLRVVRSLRTGYVQCGKRRESAACLITE